MNTNDTQAALPGPSKILLVDDQPESLMLLREVLSPLGAELVAVQSGEAALAELLREQFALIILDVRMPGMDGLQTASLIKQRERTRSVPIIFLTALDDHLDSALRAYSEGAVDYITKPWEPAILRSKVGVFVALDQQNRALIHQAQLLEQSNAELFALAEAAQAANRSKTAFLNMVSHELRTPLTVLTGYAGLIRNGTFGSPPEPMNHPLEILENKSEELSALVDSLLIAAQLESGDVPERVQEIPLNQAVSAAVSRAKGRAALVGATLLCETSPSQPAITFDASHLGRVLDNLINNALSYGSDHPWVRVSVGQEEEMATITVEDRGIGIPEEMHERIFERFVRGVANGIGPPGAGLGLYLCRDLVQRRGGSLKLLDSHEGAGSRFQVAIPLASAAANSQEVPGQTAAPVRTAVG